MIYYKLKGVYMFRRVTLMKQLKFKGVFTLNLFGLDQSKSDGLAPVFQFVCVKAANQCKKKKKKRREMEKRRITP